MQMKILLRAKLMAKKIEDCIVNGFKEVSDKCIQALFTHDGESVDDAKKRLSNNNE